jgi:pimeloyl-[acyl-carrier protein] synthase
VAQTAPEFNPLLPEFRDDPYPFYHRLRSEEPVHRSQMGFWVLTRYADVAALLRDPRMSNDPRNSAGGLRGMQPPTVAGEGPSPDWVAEAPAIMFLDPPEHTRLRTLVNKAFTPQAVESLRPRIERIVAGALDRAVAAGGMDLVEELAYPLPLTIICEMLGVPEADRAAFRAWSPELVRLLDPVLAQDALERAVRARLELGDYVRELVAVHRRRPAGNLLSALIAVEEGAVEGGARLSEDELVSMCMLLLLAGHETTASLIANAALALLRHPGQWARLVERPGLADGAVEEALRYDSPAQFVTRAAMADIEVSGRRICRGDDVVLVIAAANRDPEQFLQPDRFDLERQDVRHLSFGGGAHFCLGAPLARLESRIALAGLASHLPTLHLAGEPLRGDTLLLRGLRSLPVAA